MVQLNWWSDPREGSHRNHQKHRLSGCRVRFQDGRNNLSVHFGSCVSGTKAAVVVDVNPKEASKSGSREIWDVYQLTSLSSFYRIFLEVKIFTRMRETLNSRVVIIGGGFGGLNVAKTLAKTAVDVILIDRTNHHLFQPLLYQVATGALSPGEIAEPIRAIFKRQKNVRVIMREVITIDNREQKVVLKNKETIDFDYLIVAPGARHSYFGHDEWEKYAPGLKTVTDGLKIRERILLSFERAEVTKDAAKQNAYLTFVIVGAGPTGVEMAGAISEIAHKTILEDFRNINPTRTRVLLVEGCDCVLPSYSSILSQSALESLQGLGVEVRLHTRVSNITVDGVQVGEEWIYTPNVIWAAGNVVSPL